MSTPPGPLLPPGQRVGYAIVGLGRLSINQILPAFGKCELSRPAALVSGDRAKALALAAQYGIPNTSVYNYDEYERLSDNKDVQAVYVVLPNGLHEEYVVRGAKLQKHILCEKPMANSSSEARRMIKACQHANVKLMIAYRQQYEPNNVVLRDMVSTGDLGKLRGFIATNSQQQGDPHQWRLNKALAGGGCLPDVGLYCINAARFLSGQEPVSAQAQLWRPNDDVRFREVEASVSFSLQFRSGYLATCTTSYDVQKVRCSAWKGPVLGLMSPAFAYRGNKLTWSDLSVATRSSSHRRSRRRISLHLSWITSPIAFCAGPNLTPPGKRVYVIKSLWKQSMKRLERRVRSICLHPYRFRPTFDHVRPRKVFPGHIQTDN